MTTPLQAVIDAARALLVCYRLDPLEDGPGQLAPGYECFEAFVELRRLVNRYDGQVMLGRGSRQAVPDEPDERALVEDLRKDMSRLQLGMTALASRMNQQDWAAARVHNKVVDEANTCKQQLSEVSIDRRATKERLASMEKVLEAVRDIARATCITVKARNRLRKLVADALDEE